MQAATCKAQGTVRPVLLLRTGRLRCGWGLGAGPPPRTASEKSCTPATVTSLVSARVKARLAMDSSCSSGNSRQSSAVSVG